MAQIHRVIDSLFGSSITEDDIREAYTLEHSAFKSHAMTNAQGSAVFIHGDFNTLTADCSYAGNFERLLLYDGRALAAQHIYLGVEERFRGQKIARKHLSKALRFYGRVGIEYAYLNAADYGVVVWPQLGFEFREPSDLKLLIANFCTILAENGYEADIIPTRASAISVAPSLGAVKIGIEALVRTYENLDCRPIPMILDLTDEITKAFLRERGIL